MTGGERWRGPGPMSPAGRGLRRRELLRLAVTAGAGALLAGCRLRDPLGRGAAASAPPTPADAAAWRRLGNELHGLLVLPGNPRYPVAHELFDPAFDHIRPRGVAYCASPSDLQRCIAFARAHALPLRVRSGGHSYAGYSTCDGLVADVSRLNRIAFDRATGTATVGAGALQVDVYATLARSGVFVPGASCPTVGIGGLAQGGGIGVLDRRYGLTLDNVLALEVVTADGQLRRCDAGADADLFWACRGGGGGNFGAVASFTFRTHPVAELAMFQLSWDWAAASQAVPAWLAWASSAPDELWSNCVLAGGLPGSSPSLGMSGVYVGAPAALGTLLDRLQRAVGSAPRSRSVWQSPFADAMQSEAGCLHLSIAQCHGRAAGGVLPRQRFAAKSDFIAAPLGTAGVEALLRGLEARGATYHLAGGAVLLDACGGAVNRVAPAATAFVHRSDLCSVQYYTAWSAGASAAFLKANAAWMASYYASLRPFVSGYAYQNYIDPDLADWQHAYYGSNLPRLVGVKAKFDPDDFFHFAQSIPVRL